MQKRFLENSDVELLAAKKDPESLVYVQQRGGKKRAATAAESKEMEDDSAALDSKIMHPEIGQWVLSKKLTTEVHVVLHKFCPAAEHLREATNALGSVLHVVKLGFRCDQIPMRAILEYTISQKYLSADFNSLQSIIAKMKNAQAKEEAKPKEEKLKDDLDALQKKYEALQNATWSDMKNLMGESAQKGGSAQGKGKDKGSAQSKGKDTAGAGKGKGKGSGNAWSGQGAQWTGGGGQGGYGAGGGGKKSKKRGKGKGKGKK